MTNNVARTQATPADTGERLTEWTHVDRVCEAEMAHTIAQAMASTSRLRAANAPCESAHTLSMDEARRTIEQLRAEDAVHNDVQRALA